MQGWRLKQEVRNSYGRFMAVLGDISYVRRAYLFNFLSTNIYVMYIFRNYCTDFTNKVCIVRRMLTTPSSILMKTHPFLVFMMDTVVLKLRNIRLKSFLIF